MIETTTTKAILIFAPIVLMLFIYIYKDFNNYLKSIEEEEMNN